MAISVADLSPRYQAQVLEKLRPKGKPEPRRVPKEITEQVELLEKHYAAAEEIERILRATFRDMAEEVHIESFSVVDEPTGEEQDNGEYCDQSGNCDWGYGGSYYYPTTDGRYICIVYNC